MSTNLSIKNYYLPILTSSTLFNEKELVNNLVNLTDSLYESILDVKNSNNKLNKSNFISLFYNCIQDCYQININSPIKLVKKEEIEEKKINTSICQGQTSTGKDCRSNAVNGTNFCKRHQKQQNEVKSEVKSEIKSIKQLKTSLITKPNINLKDNEEILQQKNKPHSALKAKLLSLKDKKQPKSEESKTDKLIKATETLSLSNKIKTFDFNEEKPVNIFDKSFWKIKAYIHPTKDLLMNEITGLIVEPIDIKTVKLYGRLSNDKLILTKDLSSTIIEWCKKCDIVIEEDSEEEEEEENDNEEEEELE